MKTSSSDLIKSYLSRGGRVTQCKTYNPGGQSPAVRTNGARKRDLHSVNGRELSSIRYSELKGE